MNTIPTKSLFIGVVTIIALLAGCTTPPSQPPTLTAKKECVGLTQDGVVSMLVERGDDRCEVNLKKAKFFILNPTCDMNDLIHPPIKIEPKNIKRLDDGDPECIPIGENCNDCVKWTRGSSPETMTIELPSGDYLTLCYDESNAEPWGCDVHENDPSKPPCDNAYCMASVPGRGGNCTDNRYDCVPDTIQTGRALGDPCSAHEECMEDESGPWCFWPGDSPRTCLIPPP